jgi:hypothetical protein
VHVGRTTRGVVLVVVFVGLLVIVGPATTAGSAAAGAKKPAGFSDPEPVVIAGYSATAMEPFISPDGHDLLFNTSNQAPGIPALQYATRGAGQSFVYDGPVVGANDPNFLSGTPSLDENDNLYFVSTRSYDETLSTIYTGVFSSGQVTGVHLVSGVTGAAGGTVDFDASISADGATLYVSVGQFTQAGALDGARLAVYDKQGGGFVLDPNSTRLLRAVNNKKDLTYAASVSGTGLELFFTRANPSGGDPAIYQAVRTRLGRPFGHVQLIAAIAGFAEAPSISADGSTLYYHLLVGDRFAIESVTRPPTTSAAVRP